MKCFSFFFSEILNSTAKKHNSENKTVYVLVHDRPIMIDVWSSNVMMIENKQSSPEMDSRANAFVDSFTIITDCRFRYKPTIIALALS